MGQPYNPNAPVQQARPPSMPQSMKCSSCGGPLSPGSGLALVVCEYCGAVTTMGSGGAAEVIQKHYMLENKLSNEAALEAGREKLKKGGLRRKVAQRSALAPRALR